MSETPAEYQVGDPGDEHRAFTPCGDCTCTTDCGGPLIPGVPTERLPTALEMQIAELNYQEGYRVGLATAAALAPTYDEHQAYLAAIAPTEAEKDDAIREFAAARATLDSRRISRSQHRLAELAARLPKERVG